MPMVPDGGSFGETGMGLTVAVFGGQRPQRPLYRKMGS